MECSAVQIGATFVSCSLPLLHTLSFVYTTCRSTQCWKTFTITKAGRLRKHGELDRVAVCKRCEVAPERRLCTQCWKTFTITKAGRLRKSIEQLFANYVRSHRERRLCTQCGKTFTITKAGRIWSHLYPSMNCCTSTFRDTDHNLVKAARSMLSFM